MEFSVSHTEPETLKSRFNCLSLCVAPTELGTLKSRFNDFGLVAVGLWVGLTGLAWWGVAPTELGTGLGTLKSRFNEFGLVAVG